jgi:hypothetical protein
MSDVKNPFFFETYQHLKKVGSSIKSDYAVLYEGKFGELSVWRAIKLKTSSYIAKSGLDPSAPIEILTDVLEFLDAPKFSKKAPRTYRDLSACMFGLAQDKLIDQKEGDFLWGYASGLFAKQSVIIAVVRGTTVKPGSILQDVEAMVLARRKLPGDLAEQVDNILLDRKPVYADLQALAPDFYKKLLVCQKSLMKLHWKLDYKKIQ